MPISKSDPLPVILCTILRDGRDVGLAAMNDIEAAKELKRALAKVKGYSVSIPGYFLRHDLLAGDFEDDA